MKNHEKTNPLPPIGVCCLGLQGAKCRNLLIMKRYVRQQIYEKYGGRCAYCGCHLSNGFCVDHIIPVYRNDTDEQFERRNTHGKRKMGLVRGEDSVENYNPACRRCNGWKATMDIETFRSEISKQVERTRKYSCNFRMAEDYGLIKKTGNEVVFYFEKHS